MLYLSQFSHGRLMNMEAEEDCVIVDAAETGNTNPVSLIETEEDMGKSKTPKKQKKDPITQFLEDPHIDSLKIHKPGKIKTINTLEAIPNVEIRKCDDERLGNGLFNGPDRLLKGRIIGAYYGKIILDTRKAEIEEIVQVTEDAWIVVDENCKLISVNHSCDPNSQLSYARFNHIIVPVIKTIQDISPNEEITIDYGWVTTDASKLKVPCYCKNDQCKQFLYSPPTKHLGVEELATAHNVFYKSIDIYSPTDMGYQHLEKGTWFERRPRKEELDYSNKPFIYQVVAIGKKQKPASKKDQLLIYGQFFRRGDDEVVARNSKCPPRELLATFCFEEVEPKLFLNTILVEKKPSSKLFFTTGRFFSEDQETIFDDPPTFGKSCIFFC